METPVGTTGAEKAGTESAAAKSASPESGANGSVKASGVDERFAQLTGEISRKDELIKKLRDEKAAIEEKFKTEDEKRLEQLVEAKYGPKLKREEELNAWATQQRDSLLAKLPEEHRGLVLTGDHVPVEQQIAQMQAALNLLNQKGVLPAFSSGPNPGTAVKKTYTKAEYDAWANSAGDVRKHKVYDDQRDEMMSALREGRVEGLR